MFHVRAVQNALLIVATASALLLVGCQPKPSNQTNVPNVMGQAQAAASTAITGAGLVVGVVTQEFSVTVVSGSIISQDPVAGTLVAPGSTVALTVSKGPQPQSVPDLVGQTQAAASTAITGAGLTVGTITQEFSATVASGTVISQNPAAGTSAAPGSSVSLTVSKGPQSVTVPNVVGQTQSAAGTALTGANLTTGTVAQERSNTVAAGLVISQNPASGGAAPYGSAVALVVSTGVCPATVPDVVGQTQSAASTAITGVTLIVGVITQAYSQTVPLGEVISQNPAAGASVAPGTAVALVISIGPEVGEGEGEAQRDVGILIDTYMGAESFATNANPNLIDGRVMVFDIGTMPTTLHWVVKNSAGETSGDLSVDTAGAWNVSLALANGDNLLTFTVPDTPAVKTLNLTHTPGYLFGAPLCVTPDVAYVKEDQEFTALITLADPKTNPANVKLLRYDGGTGTEVAAFSDAGDTTSGDELAGDGIYACKFHLNETQPGTVAFRTQAAFADGSGSALSESSAVLVTKHWEGDELSAVLQQMNDFGRRVSTSATAEGMKAACVQVAEELAGNPDVEECGTNQDNWGVWVVYKNGFKTGLLPTLPGYHGGGAKNSASAAPPLPESVPTTYQSYADRHASLLKTVPNPEKKVRSKRVFAFSPYHHIFGEDPVTELPTTLKNYPFDTSGMPVTAQRADKYKNLGDYGIIGISSHGTLWGKRNEELVALGSSEMVEFVQDTHGHERLQYESDLHQGRLVIITVPYKNPSTEEETEDPHYFILPKYIEHYSGAFPFSLVLADACYSAANSSMARAFLGKGAGAYLGWTEPTYGSACYGNTGKLIENLLVPSTMVGDAYALLPSFGNSQWDYRLLGDPGLFLLYGISDGGFENEKLTQAWTVVGDARRISVFGLELPAAGNGMAMLLQDSSISQTFLCGGNTQDFLIGYKNYFRVNSCDNPTYWDRPSLTVRIEEVANPDSFVEQALDPNWPMHRASAPLLGTIPCQYNSGPWITDWANFFAVHLPAKFQNKVVRLKISFVRGNKNVFEDAVLLDNISLYP